MGTEVTPDTGHLGLTLIPFISSFAHSYGNFWKVHALEHLVHLLSIYCLSSYLPVHSSLHLSTHHSLTPSPTHPLTHD